MKKSNHSKMDSSLKDIDLLTEVQELQVLGGNDNGANEKSQGSHTPTSSGIRFYIGGCKFFGNCKTICN